MNNLGEKQNMDCPQVSITSENYIEHVKRTEPDYGVVRDRCYNVAMRKQLAIAMGLAIEAGKLTDAVKKKLFYGREYDGAVIGHKFQHASELLGHSNALLGHSAMLRLDDQQTLRLLHADLGLVSESAEEFTQALYNYIFQSKPLDLVNVNEELGDIGWYWGVGVDASGHTMNQCLTTNIRKLATRYPAKFEELKALVRDIAAEREVLEEGTNA